MMLALWLANPVTMFIKGHAVALRCMKSPFM
jgi:hypothetical protein